MDLKDPNFDNGSMKFRIKVPLISLVGTLKKLCKSREWKTNTDGYVSV
jgi:hypothetical protein